MKSDENEKPKVSSAEQIKSTSTPSLHAETLTQKKHESERAKPVVVDQVKTLTPSSRLLPDSRHRDENAKIYYSKTSSHTPGRRLPVQKLGGGTNPFDSQHSSDGHSSGDPLTKPLLGILNSKVNGETDHDTICTLSTPFYHYTISIHSLVNFYEFIILMRHLCVLRNVGAGIVYVT
ncbi:uncharacterized protein FA14DRAFT_178882 [Meira miltonrushii]|uniref:Uncharacterized protein n=1 Tax=Meira miltonrushii TaxID=1280837 RepID=A0A316VD69_9BASI|nr:uncharacterized protein FA14DRAFT_178882 [Meira miltonrushii]PWN35512.1 hypothetical protein FA14DRAFT_178882 [Meira miltonrushii]